MVLCLDFGCVPIYINNVFVVVVCYLLYANIETYYINMYVCMHVCIYFKYYFSSLIKMKCFFHLRNHSLLLPSPFFVTVLRFSEGIFLKSNNVNKNNNNNNVKSIILKASLIYFYYMHIYLYKYIHTYIAQASIQISFIFFF